MGTEARTTEKKQVIALVMSDIDAEFFAKQLKPVAPHVHMVHVKDLEVLSQVLATDHDIRILSFCSPHIISKEMLDRVKGNAFNFHPGPPERPGYMPAPFAIHEKSKDFGATFHHMQPKVDTGFIIEVARFEVKDGIRQEDLEIQAYKALLLMVMQRKNQLANLSFEFEPCGEEWSGVKTTKKDLEKILPLNP